MERDGDGGPCAAALAALLRLLPCAAPPRKPLTADDPCRRMRLHPSRAGSPTAACAACGSADVGCIGPSAASPAPGSASTPPSPASRRATPARSVSAPGDRWYRAATSARRLLAGDL